MYPRKNYFIRHTHIIHSMDRRELHVSRVTKCDTIYTSTIYTLNSEASLVIFLQISASLVDKVLRKATGEHFFSGGLSSYSCSYHLLLQFSSQ